MEKKVNRLGWIILNLLLSILPGALLNSLSRHVNTYEHEWYSHSKHKTSRRHGRFQHLMVWGTTHPILFVLSFTIPIGLFSFGAPWLIERFFGFNFFGPKPWARADFLTYIGAAYATQATIAALVYPLVVSFIGLLLQRRASAKVVLAAYLLDTGVVPSGASSFILLFAMTMGYLALPFLPFEAPQELALISFLWLGINLLMAIWFLYRTTQFLQDEHSAQVLAWLATSVTLPRDVRAHMAGLLFQNAQSNGWIPGKVFDEMSDVPSVFLYPLNEGDVCVRTSSKVTSVVVDVRLRLLSWAINLWLRDAARDNKKVNTPKNMPLLAFPTTLGQEGQTFVLARVRDAAEPSWLGRLLIRTAFVLKRKRKSAMPFSTDEVLAEIAHDVVSQIEVRNYPRFQQAMLDLRNLHVDLIYACSAGVNGGISSSAALLQSPYGFASQSFSRDWMAQYQDINAVAMRAIEVDSRYFSTVAYTSKKFGDAFSEEPLDILRDALLPARNLFFQMQQWWAEKAGDIPTDQLLKGIRLSTPFNKCYANAVSTWVGAWEALNFVPSKNTKQTDIELWDFMRKKVLLFADHIDFTAVAMVEAVTAGDVDGAEFLQDSLVKWWGNGVHNFARGQVSYRDDNITLNIGLADLEYDKVLGVIPGLPDGLQRRTILAQYLSYVLMKYWEDVRLVVAALLFSDSGFINSADNLGMQIAMNVLLMQSRHDGGNLTGTQLNEAGRVLARVLCIESSERSYSLRFEKVLESVTRNRPKLVISGRIYSWNGSQDLQSLQGGLATIMIVLHQLGEASPNVERAVGLSTRNLDVLGILSRFSGQVGKALAPEIVADRIRTIEELRKGLERTGTVDEARNASISLCQQFEEAASKHEESVIVHTPLSQSQFDIFERKCSDAVFQINGKFNFELTTTFEPIETDLPTVTQVISGISKLPFTVGPLEELSSDEVESISQLLGKCVLQEAIERLIQRDDIQEIRDDTPDAFYRNLLFKFEEIRGSGLEPVVLAAEFDTSELLSPWQINEDALRPRNVSVLPSKGVEDENVWSFVNGTPVYLVPMASKRVIVISRSHVKTLQYKKTQGQCGFKLETEPQDERKLKMSFTFAVQFAPEINSVNL